jgi:ATP-dependent DNA helicase RecQ
MTALAKATMHFTKGLIPFSAPAAPGPVAAVAKAKPRKRARTRSRKKDAMHDATGDGVPKPPRRKRSSHQARSPPSTRSSFPTPSKVVEEGSLLDVPDATIELCEDILRTKFGFPSFRPMQRNVVASVLLRQDTLVVMPTGGGKSLCYQLPALAFQGLSIVVSPLVALQQDQVRALHQRGLAAAALNSSMTPKERAVVWDQLRAGALKMLYVAPETLLNTTALQAFLRSATVDMLVIDEAHCVSAWGSDFRREYSQLRQVRDWCPGATVVALTATATHAVRQDIMASLGFRAANSFCASFDRPNLYLAVERRPATAPKATARLVEFVRRFAKGTHGIVYASTKSNVDTLTAELCRQGFGARRYHAGLGVGERKETLRAFLDDDPTGCIVVATSAFGMGIDKADVRFVVQWGLPPSIEDLYQQGGRGGRDGALAHWLVLWNDGDRHTVEWFAKQKDGAQQRLALERLDQILAFVRNGGACRRVGLLGYFGETYDQGRCGDMCDVCCPRSPPTALEQLCVNVSSDSDDDEPDDGGDEGF